MRYWYTDVTRNVYIKSLSKLVSQIYSSLGYMWNLHRYTTNIYSNTSLPQPSMIFQQLTECRLHLKVNDVYNRLVILTR